MSGSKKYKRKKEIKRSKFFESRKYINIKQAIITNKSLNNTPLVCQLVDVSSKYSQSSLLYTHLFLFKHSLTKILLSIDEKTKKTQTQQRPRDPLAPTSSLVLH